MCSLFHHVQVERKMQRGDSFFAVLHNQDVEREITSIKVRNRGKPDLKTAARQLFQTVKDHNNATVQEMVDLSKTYCCRNAPASSSETEDKEDHEEFVLTHFPTCPSCFVIVNHDRCLQEFDNARQKLQSDRLVVETTLRTELDTCSSGTPSNDVISTICKVKRVMQSRTGYAPNRAQFTYISLMDVSSYLNELLANDAINKHLVKHLKTVETILSHPACEIILQIHFDFNLIEVSNGFCYFQSSILLFGNVKADFQSSHEAPRSSLRVLASN